MAEPCAKPLPILRSAGALAALTASALRGISDFRLLGLWVVAIPPRLGAQAASCGGASATTRHYGPICWNLAEPSRDRHSENCQASLPGPPCVRSFVPGLLRRVSSFVPGTLRRVRAFVLRRDSAFVPCRSLFVPCRWEVFRRGCSIARFSSSRRRSPALAAANHHRHSCTHVSPVASISSSNPSCKRFQFTTAAAAARHGVRRRGRACRLRLVLVYPLVSRGVGVVGAPSQSPAWQPSGAQLAKSREHEAAPIRAVSDDPTSDSAAQLQQFVDDLKAKVFTMKDVYFKTDSTGPVRFFCTPDGRIDYSALGFEFVLDSTSIKLNGSRFPIEGLKSQYTWEEIFKKEGEPVGTKEDPVIVTGKPPVHGASTGI